MVALALDAQRIQRWLRALVLIDYMAVGAMRTVLPYYAKALGAAGRHVGALETAYGVGQITGALLLGRASDTRGRKPILLLSFIGAAIGYSVAALAVVRGSVQLLLLSRLPVGLAKNTVTATRAIISDVTAPSERSQALAMLFAGCSLGYAVGPYLGGLLADSAGATPLPSMLCAITFAVLVPCTHAMLPETASAAAASASPRTPALDRPLPPATPATPAAPAASPLPAGTLLLLVGCTLPEGALVVFSSTALALLSHAIGWSASDLGLYSSIWGVASGALSLTLWPYLLSESGRLTDLGGLRLGVGSLGLACAIIATHGSARVLWGVLPLGTIAVGMIRSLPPSILTKAAPPHSNGSVLGRLDAMGSLCRVLLPTSAGWLSDHYGVWAAFAASAGLCMAGLLLIEIWGALYNCKLTRAGDAGSDVAPAAKKRQ